MKKTLILPVVLLAQFLQAQNVGIGVTTPQQKLHVAGNVRVDALSGSTGILTYNNSGDLVPLANSGNINEALLGNGAWGNLNGTVPAGAIVATETYNDVNLINKGFRLLGSIPGFTKYVSSNFSSVANTWAVTYHEGNVLKYTPPYFDRNDLFVWADTVFYLFADNSLYAYNPVSDIWRFVLVNPTSYKASSESQAIWSGTEMIVWGGNFSVATDNGFRYKPATNVWSAIPVTNQPLARGDFAMHYISDRLIIWGGLSSGGTLLSDGAILNISTGIWTTINPTGAPSPRIYFGSVSNLAQNTMIVWGGKTSVASIIVAADGAMLNPLTNTWAPISPTNAPSARAWHTATWSGSEMIVFGGVLAGNVNTNSGGRYNPVLNTWITTNTSGAPSISSHAGAWTGTKLLISGGISSIGSGQPFSGIAYLYDPVGNSWASAAAMGVLKAAHMLVPANDMILAFGGSTSIINPVSGTHLAAGGWPQGSRYFISGGNLTSKTQIINATNLYLYIKN